MTNADIVRAMTDEELVVFLDRVEQADIDFSMMFCNLCINSDCIDCKKAWLNMDYNEKYFE